MNTFNEQHRLKSKSNLTFKNIPNKGARGGGLAGSATLETKQRQMHRPNEINITNTKKMKGWGKWRKNQERVLVG